MTAQLSLDRPPPGVVWLVDHPDLTMVLSRAVEAALARWNLTRELDADLAVQVERAASAAAVSSYQRMEVVASRATAAAAADRRARTHLVAAKARVMAERVADAAVEVHDIEEASAHGLVLVAAATAADLAEGVDVDDEVAASVAAALVVKAMGEAAAVTATAQASAASRVAHAAAAAAAEVAAEAAAIDSAAEATVGAEATDRRRDALQTCYDVAVDAAEAVLADHP